MQPLSTYRGPLCTCSCITHLRDSLILFLFSHAELQTVTPGLLFHQQKATNTSDTDSGLSHHFPNIGVGVQISVWLLYILIDFQKPSHFPCIHSQTFSWQFYSQHNQVGVFVWMGQWTGDWLVKSVVFVVVFTPTNDWGLHWCWCTGAQLHHFSLCDQKPCTIGAVGGLLLAWACITEEMWVIFLASVPRINFFFFALHDETK